MAKRLFESDNYIIALIDGEFNRQYEKKFVKYKTSEDGYRIIQAGEDETVIETTDIINWNDDETGSTFYTEASLKTFLRTKTGLCCPESGAGGGVTSVNGQTGVVILDADDIDDSSTVNKFSSNFNIDLDSSESSVVRVFAGGRTTYTITHTLNSLDVTAQTFRLSNGRTVGLRIERTGVNTIDISRSGN